MKNLKDIRVDYMLMQLDEKDVNHDPFIQFDQWLQAALNAEVNEPTAMGLATASDQGKPLSRIVLLKEVNDQGFVFFTNYNSRKGQHLHENPYACLLFFWAELQRQVRIEGHVEKISPRESDDYFHSRPLASRIGAISSPQSQVIDNRSVLEQYVYENSQKYTEKTPQRPDHWGGYVVIPESIEFWQGRESRLHDRILYSYENETWVIRRLAP